MKFFGVFSCLLLAFFKGYSSDVFSIKIVKEEKIRNDSLFFQMIDQNRAIDNAGIVFFSFYQLPLGTAVQKMGWLENGICNQFIYSNGLSNGKFFLSVYTQKNAVENSRSQFLIFIEKGKLLSVQHLEDTLATSLIVEPESGTLLSGFSNKIMIAALDNKIGKVKTEKITISTETGEILSSFIVAGKRLVDIYLEDGKRYLFRTVTSNGQIILKGNDYGYVIKCLQIKDSIDIEIYRGKLEPSEKLSFCVRVNNKIDTVAQLVFDDSLHVLQTKMYGSSLVQSFVSFLLINEQNNIIAQRYWQPDSDIYNTSSFYQKAISQQLTIDSSYGMEFSCRGCNREKITYQITNANNALLHVGQVLWKSDTVFAIQDMQIFGEANLVLQVSRNDANWKPDIQSIEVPTPKPPDFFYVNEEKVVVDQKAYKVDTLIANTRFLKNGVLPEVTVKGVRKTRLDELEEKYVKNIMFKSLFSVDINVMDDENSRSGLTLFEYIRNKIPITNIVNYENKLSKTKQKFLTYRGIPLSFWIDEAPFEDQEKYAEYINSINPSEVAYIKLLKNGLRSAGGTILIYTKRGDEKPKDNRFAQQVLIQGIEGWDD
jgi:hypothetical protein